MAVIAKFRVSRIEDGGIAHPSKKPLRTIILSPVYSDDAQSENRQFWEATPSGEIRLGVVNQAAWDQFELAADYYVTFERAEK